MPKLTKIYTRTGDDGTTALGSRRRVPKDSLRVAAYGDVDELNATIGVAIAAGLNQDIREALTKVQNDLFHLGTDLAFPQEERALVDIPKVEERHVQRLEELIDAATETIGPLQNFILPVGTLSAAQLHIARTVCRRAERSLIALSREEEVGNQTVQYLNRLSDALFVLARLENYYQGRRETLWDSHR